MIGSVLFWFGFNPGSQLAASGEVNRVAISHVFLTTNLAAVCGGLGTMFTPGSSMVSHHSSLTLNGILAGLVAITAGCDLVSPLVLPSSVSWQVSSWYSLIEFIDTKLHIDDPVGASSVYGVCGIFGTLMTGLFAPMAVPSMVVVSGLFGAQLFGIICIDLGQLQQASSSSGVSRRSVVSVLTRESRRKVSKSTSTVRVATTKVLSYIDERDLLIKVLVGKVFCSNFAAKTF